MIRLLNIDNDLELFREAWSWRYAAPKWFQEALDIFKETFEEYLEAIPNELHYGVFIEGEISAIVRLVEIGPRVFNTHLYAKRKTDFGMLLEACQAIRDHLFAQGAIAYIGWIPSNNRSIARLYENLGLRETGMRCFKGTIRGRLAEFRHYCCINPLLNNVT